MAIGKVAGALAGRFLRRGGKDIILGSIPGALATTAMSTVTTGNPLAGLTVGATDLVASSLLGRGLGSRTVGQALGKVSNTIPIAGKIQQALPGRYIGGPGKGKRQYMMSLPQSAATAVGSVGAAITLEPYFYPKQEAAVLADQYPQLSNVQVDQSQMVTQAQQLSQLKQQNNLGQQALSPGTMYQLQGMPLATDPGIDPYNIMRGQL